MSLKTTKILYRITTLLIAWFHIPGLFFMHSEMAIEGMKHVQLDGIIWLQQIIGYALPLGALALIVPMIPSRLKEWAYAGLAFVYIGAFWAHFSLWHPMSEVMMPIVTGVLLAVSYCMWHKMLKTAWKTL
jgi:hypothetical protein